MVFVALEGSITLVVPLQEAVYKKEDRDRFPKQNQQETSAIVAAFYIIFAIICWAYFDDRVQIALTASLPEGSYATTLTCLFHRRVIHIPATGVCSHGSDPPKCNEKDKNMGHFETIASSK